MDPAITTALSKGFAIPAATLVPTKAPVETVTVDATLFTISKK
jgi:hypothetical protein